MNRFTALSLMCCFTACGLDGSSSDQSKRDPLTPGVTDPCASVDATLCDSTPGCALSADCPPCTGQICPAMACLVVCRSIVLPPPAKCSGLDEATCSATKGCQPLYGGVCPACSPTSPCPPCSNGYLGCTEVIAPPVDHCVGLDERACNRTSGCQGDYTATSFSACKLDVSVCTVAPAPAP